MSGNNSSPLGMPADGERVLLMNLLEEELNTLEAQFAGKLSRESSLPGENGLPLSNFSNSTELDLIRLIECRLYLRIFYFFDSTHVDHRRSGILKAYSTATEFIALINSSHALFNYLSYSPISSLKFLCASLATLIQVLNSNLYACVDYAAGVASVEAALAALRHSSIEDNDVFIRGAEILSYVWRMQKDDQELKKQSPTLLIKSRLSASLLYDSLWRWRQYHIKSQTLEGKDFMEELIFSQLMMTKVPQKVQTPALAT